METVAIHRQSHNVAPATASLGRGRGRGGTLRRILPLVLIPVCLLSWQYVINEGNIPQLSLTLRRRQQQQPRHRRRKTAEESDSQATRRELYNNYNGYYRNYNNNNNYDQNYNNNNNNGGNNNAAADDDDGDGNNGGGGNYLWARDDDDDYYVADDDGGYWEANHQYSTYGWNNYNNDDHYSGGGAVQGDYEANYNSQNFDDDALTYEQQHGVPSNGDEDGEDSEESGVNRLGHLTYDQRQWLAVILAIVMVLLLVCFLFGPFLLEKFCSCWRNADHKKTQSDLVTSFTELGNF